jgi:hypothetical protein
MCVLLAYVTPQNLTNNGDWNSYYHCSAVSCVRLISAMDSFTRASELLYIMCHCCTSWLSSV